MWHRSGTTVRSVTSDRDVFRLRLAALGMPMTRKNGRKWWEIKLWCGILGMCDKQLFFHFIKHQVPYNLKNNMPKIIVQCIRCHVPSLVWIEQRMGKIFEVTERWYLTDVWYQDSTERLFTITTTRRVTILDIGQSRYLFLHHTVYIEQILLRTRGIQKILSFVPDFAHLRVCVSLFKHSSLANFQWKSTVMTEIALTLSHISQSTVLMPITMPYSLEVLTLPFSRKTVTVLSSIHDAMSVDNNFMQDFINSFRGKPLTRKHMHQPIFMLLILPNSSAHFLHLLSGTAQHK